MRRRLAHTIRLIIDDDTAIVQRSRELWSYHLRPEQLFIIIINLAALLMVVRDIAVTLRANWEAGLGVCAAGILVLFSFQVGYSPG